MPYSTCPYCSKRSYSAADLETWICPYCGKKIREKESNQNERKNEEEEQGQ